MCDHANFECYGNVIRLYELDGRVLVGYTLEVRLVCMDCLLPFRFLGLPGGLHTTSPTVSFDGLEARLPVATGVLDRAEGEANADQAD